VYVTSIMKNVFKQQKARPKVNVCAAAENLEEELQGVYKVWAHGKKHIKSGPSFSFT